MPLVLLENRCWSSTTRRCVPRTPLVHLGMCVRAAGSAGLPLLLAQHDTSLRVAYTAALELLDTCACAAGFAGPQLLLAHHDTSLCAADAADLAHLFACVRAAGSASQPTAGGAARPVAASRAQR